MTTTVDRCERCFTGRMFVDGADNSGDQFCVACGFRVYAPLPDVSVTAQERQTWRAGGQGHRDLLRAERQKRQTLAIAMSEKGGSPAGIGRYLEVTTGVVYSYLAKGRAGKRPNVGMQGHKIRQTGGIAQAP